MNITDLSIPQRAMQERGRCIACTRPRDESGSAIHCCLCMSPVEAAEIADAAEAAVSDPGMESVRNVLEEKPKRKPGRPPGAKKKSWEPRTA